MTQIPSHSQGRSLNPALTVNQHPLAAAKKIVNHDCDIAELVYRSLGVEPIRFCGRRFEHDRHVVFTAYDVRILMNTDLFAVKRLGRNRITEIQIGQDLRQGSVSSGSDIATKRAEDTGLAFPHMVSFGETDQAFHVAIIIQKVAGSEGFEPSWPLDLSVFKTDAINRSASYPNSCRLDLSPAWGNHHLTVMARRHRKHNVAETDGFEPSDPCESVT